ncbi:MAG TPA: TIGR03435 family protein [Acidobacteriaceae bacterium]|jgi:uncharacterized protein (TIGR03435 family)|nr:TIGR03435 family protein [Acidobacteriaceae bacterium]
MNRALIFAVLSAGIAAGTTAAVAQDGGKVQHVAAIETGATFQPVRGAIRVDSVNVPFEVKIDATTEAADSSSIEMGADHWDARGYDLKTLISEIFEMDARLVDVPENVAANGRYDVSLSVPTELDQDSMQRILVKALTQRFGLTIKPETRTMNVYVLSAPEGAGSGLKQHLFARRSGLKTLVSGGDDSNDQGGRITYMGKDCSGVSSGGITVEGGTIADFRRTLEPDLDRVLVDETKLRGSYDFKIGLYANQTQLFELMRADLGLVVTPEQRNVTVLAVRPADPNGDMLQAKL